MWVQLYLIIFPFEKINGGARLLHREPRKNKGYDLTGELVRAVQSLRKKLQRLAKKQGTLKNNNDYID